MLTLTVLCTSVHTSHSIDYWCTSPDATMTSYHVTFFRPMRSFHLITVSRFVLCLPVCVRKRTVCVYMCVDVGKIILVSAYSFQWKQLLRDRLGTAVLCALTSFRLRRFGQSTPARCQQLEYFVPHFCFVVFVIVVRRSGVVQRGPVADRVDQRFRLRVACHFVLHRWNIPHLRTRRQYAYDHYAQPDWSLLCTLARAALRFASPLSPWERPHHRKLTACRLPGEIRYATHDTAGRSPPSTANFG